MMSARPSIGVNAAHNSTAVDKMCLLMMLSLFSVASSLREVGHHQVSRTKVRDIATRPSPSITITPGSGTLEVGGRFRN